LVIHFIYCWKFSVFLVIFCILSYLQLFIRKLYIYSGTANAPIFVIVFLAFHSHFKVILNLLWWGTSFYLTPYWCTATSSSISFCKLFANIYVNQDGVREWTR
jgi:O-antigen ligase